MKQLLSLALAISYIAAADAAVLKISLNNLVIGIDERTGSVVSLDSSNTGRVLVTQPQAAGVLDVAYPVESFAAMRLASRFSRAQVTLGQNKVTIRWERLGASRGNLELPSGAVRAQVTIQAANDGRSIIWRCRIENDSGAAIPQVLFPDLWGLKPVAGVANTRLRMASGTVSPFEGPVNLGPGVPYFSAWPWKEYPAGGYYQLNALRWLDFGGFDGGLSVFQKKWGTEDWPSVITHRTEGDPMSLRMAWEHKQEIKPGQRWESGEFWFTPHAAGWAKGIEVYRDYVRQLNPPRAMPVHVTEDIGYQTIWMIQTVEVDPVEAAFRFEDLPRVAEDARRHGIHEIVPWGWNTYSTLPIPTRPELGSVEDLLDAVRRSHELGVNIAPFISISIVRNQYAARYGVETSNDDWTYHGELIPMFRPYYTKFWNGVEIDASNDIWRKDVTDALEQWIDRGVASFSWDVFRVHGKDGKRPQILPMIEKIRARAHARDPESTFSGESVSHLEFDSQALDYLWNWRGYEDAGPITNVLKTPRVSCNVESSALVVAKCFADNLYLNAMPRRPDQPNGTALISDVPELSAALMQAAALRRQFLPFFVDGTFIGDSVLSEPAGAFVRGYQLEGKLLVIVLNDRKEAGAVSVRSHLGAWLPRAASYEVTAYDGAGRKLGSTVAGNPQWFGATPRLEPGAMAFFEIVSK